MGNLILIVINNFDLVKMEWGNGPPNPSASSALCCHRLDESDLCTCTCTLNQSYSNRMSGLHSVKNRGNVDINLVNQDKLIIHCI